MELTMTAINEMLYFLRKGAGYKPESNEDLVDLIHITDKSEYWNKLYKKTENSIHSVFHKDVNAFYKKNIKEDIYSILKTGWSLAVKKFDRRRSQKFHAFAIYLMRQQYVMFARRITEDKNGVSVRHQLINNVESSRSNDMNSGDKEGCISAIMKDDSFEIDINKFELRDFMLTKLKELKKEEPLAAELIYKHFYCHKTQKSLCEEYGLNQSTISRKIKNGYKYLRSIINREEVAFI